MLRFIHTSPVMRMMMGCSDRHGKDGFVLELYF